MDQVLTSTCPECNTIQTFKIDHREGIKYCPKCGTVLEATIDRCSGAQIQLPHGLNLNL